mmetsp:Transcript_523/g.1563  ORF Transcript_523/g.1563 Transcript_523/m.1563 type:complete len:202 (-) Transcript_523:250-855(-)
MASSASFIFAIRSTRSATSVSCSRSSLYMSPPHWVMTTSRIRCSKRLRIGGQLYPRTCGFSRAQTRKSHPPAEKVCPHSATPKHTPRVPHHEPLLHRQDPRAQARRPADSDRRGGGGGHGEQGQRGPAGRTAVAGDDGDQPRHGRHRAEERVGRRRDAGRPARRPQRAGVPGGDRDRRLWRALPRRPGLHAVPAVRELGRD